MLKYYDFSGVSFLVDKSFECENASENAAPRFDLVHNPIDPYLTDSKFTPFSAPSRGGLYSTITSLSPQKVIFFALIQGFFVDKCDQYFRRYSTLDY